MGHDSNQIQSIQTWPICQARWKQQAFDSNAFEPTTSSPTPWLAGESESHDCHDDAVNSLTGNLDSWMSCEKRQRDCRNAPLRALLAPQAGSGDLFNSLFLWPRDCIKLVGQPLEILRTPHLPDVRGGSQNCRVMLSHQSDLNHDSLHLKVTIKNSWAAFFVRAFKTWQCNTWSLPCGATIAPWIFVDWFKGMKPMPNRTPSGNNQVSASLLAPWPLTRCVGSLVEPQLSDLTSRSFVVSSSGIGSVLLQSP